MKSTAYLLAWIDFATQRVTHIGVYSEPHPTSHVLKGCWAELARFDATSFHASMQRAEAHLERAYPKLAELYGREL